MNDLEFRRMLKRYLERRGEKAGSALYRTAERAGNVLAAAAPERPARRPPAVSAGKEPQAAVASTKRPSPPSGPERPALKPRETESAGGAQEPQRADSTDGPPPVRRVYAEREPSKRAPDAAQADLFGEPAPVEPVSELSGLDLGALEERVSTCTLCPLCEGRNRTVFGAGDPAAKIVFIGEAPGREEDLRGEPFVGRAGQLLTRILASVGFTREEVYITNILKCRPPDNRDPNEQEVRACKPYLKRQIELLEPVLICALGRVAGQNLLERNASLSVLRQHIHYYEDVRTIVTYHPAALLRNPNLKRAAWEDIQETRRIYDEALKEM